MWFSYLKTSLRSLLRNRLYTMINIFGLALAIASCLLIFLYERHEWSYDHFHVNADRLFRISPSYDTQRFGVQHGVNTSAKLVDAAEGMIPQIESYVRMGEGEASIMVGERSIQEDVLYAGPHFFEIFSFPLDQGVAESALSMPNQVVLSQSAAEKLFNRIDVVDEEVDIFLNGVKTPFLVSAVMEDMPENTVFHSGVVLPFEVLRNTMRNLEEQNNWGFTYSSTYVLVQDDIEAAKAQDELNRFLDGLGHVHDEGSGTVTTFCLQSVKDLHVDLRNPEDHRTESAPDGLLILAAIGLMILIIACINFTTLTIGASVYRMKEVGIRKILGAIRYQLMRQFWVETALISLIAIMIGLFFAELTLPLFSQVAGMDLQISMDGANLLFLAGLWLFMLVIAGFYPSAVMSGVPMLSVFHGALRIGGRSRLRRILVFIQLGLSIGLIALTIIMNRQLDFIMNRELGYHGEQVVQIEAINQDRSGRDATRRLREALASDPHFLAVSGGSNKFGGSPIWFNWEYNGERYEDCRTNTVDYDFIETMGMELVAGRDFDQENESDATRAIIVNEAMVRYMEWDDPIGQRLPGEFREHEVIGVVKDFHYEGLQEPIHPIVLAISPGIIFSIPLQCGWSYYVTVQFSYVRLAPDDIPEAMRILQETWEEVAPNFAFEYSFVDEDVAKLYEDERRWSTIVSASTLFAILIAALGLVGLATLQVGQRTREIGIRKVLGARESSLVLLLTREFSILVLIAGVIVGPVAFWIAKNWLEGFAYKISLTPVPMLIATIAALGIAWLTAGALAWIAAKKNPVKTLRYE